MIDSTMNLPSDMLPLPPLLLRGHSIVITINHRRITLTPQSLPRMLGNSLFVLGSRSTTRLHFESQWIILRMVTLSCPSCPSLSIYLLTATCRKRKEKAMLVGQPNLRQTDSQSIKTIGVSLIVTADFPSLSHFN